MALSIIGSSGSSSSSSDGGGPFARTGCCGDYVACYIELQSALAGHFGKRNGAIGMLFHLVQHDIDTNLICAKH